MVNPQSHKNRITNSYVMARILTTILYDNYLCHILAKFKRIFTGIQIGGSWISVYMFA